MGEGVATGNGFVASARRAPGHNQMPDFNDLVYAGNWEKPPEEKPPKTKEKKITQPALRPIISPNSPAHLPAPAKPLHLNITTIRHQQTIECASSTAPGTWLGHAEIARPKPSKKVAVVGRARRHGLRAASSRAPAMTAICSRR